MNLIEVTPDDVLVLRTPDRLHQAQHDAALEVLRRILGPGQRILILDGGQALDVIRVSLSGKVETNDIVQYADQALASAAVPGGYTMREVQHVDTDEPEAKGIPPHVWLYRNMLTDLQAVAPLGRDETNGQYAVAIDQLTEDQWYVPHILNQIALRSDSYGTEARDLLPSAQARAAELQKNNT